MTRNPVVHALVIVLPIGAAGCATVPPDRGFDRVQAAVEGRIDAVPQWSLDRNAELIVQAHVDDLLASPLTPEAASEIAILNSPRLRAAFARVGIASADLIEAGLLENPRLSAAVGFPDRPPSAAELDFGLTFNILRLLMLPARKQIAGLQLDAATLDVADEVLRTRANAQVAFLELQGAEHLASVLREIALAAEASAEFAGRLREAGNLSDLELANEQALYEEARLAYARSLAEAASLRERLNAVLGLWGDRIGWSIDDRLPELPLSEPEMADLESLAVRQRFDLAATAKEVESLYAALGLQRKWRYILAADAGFIAARDTDGQWVFGPQLSIELPIFNQRQADIARLEAALRGAESRLEAIAIDTRADVRRLLDRLYALRYEAEHFKETIVPLRQRITGLTQEQYNFMLMDTFDLLAAKRAESDAYRAYLTTIRDYWITRAELERAVGGGLPIGLEADEADADLPATPSPDQPADTQHTHEHGDL